MKSQQSIIELETIPGTGRTLDHFASPLPLMNKFVSLETAQAGGGIVAVAALGANQTGSFHRQTFLIFHFGLNWHNKGLRGSLGRRILVRCCALGPNYQTPPVCSLFQAFMFFFWFKFFTALCNELVNTSWFIFEAKKAYFLAKCLSFYCFPQGKAVGKRPQ